VLAAVVHYLASEYKWNIGYIMSLTRPQIRMMMDGANYIHEQSESRIAKTHPPRQPSAPGAPNVPEMKTTKNNQIKPDQIDSILSMPGLKMSEKSLKKLQYLREKHSKE
jgi:hypothetical protein